MTRPQDSLKTFFIAGCIYILFSAYYPLTTHSFEKTFTNSLGMEFVLIPAGTFVMGSPVDELNRDESEIQHKMTISKPFYIQTSEVTLKQWRTVMGKNFLSLRRGPDTLPVTKVSWYDSIEFIKGLNQRNEGTYRLPTEAEWEYAARSETKSTYCFGSTDTLSQYAWYNRNSSGKTHPVGQLKPNAWGLYDVHGNVHEWCLDWFDRNYYSQSPSISPGGPLSGLAKALRGGDWGSEEWYCRCASRSLSSPERRSNRLGFRLIKIV